MRFIFSRVFWGLVLLGLGVGLLLQNIYGIDFPFWGIFWAVIIIAIGISILFPSRSEWKYQARYGSTSDESIVFGEGRVRGGEKNQYNIIFSKGEIDLRKVRAEKETKRIEINNVFAGGVVLIDPAQPARITVSGAFGGVDLPNGKTATFGDAKYATKNFDEKKPYLDIYITNVFGGLEVIEK